MRPGIRKAVNVRILLLLLALPAVILAFALIAMWAPLPRPFPPPMSGARNQMAAISTGILGATYLVGLAAYVVASFLRAGRVLDTVLTTAGLATESYMIFGRRYRGMIQGRQVAVTYLPSRGVWPAQLDVRVSAELGIRVAMGMRRPLLGCRDCPRLGVAQEGLAGLHVYAEDEEGARRLLADPKGGDAVRRLVVDGEGFREVYLQPEDGLVAVPSSWAGREPDRAVARGSVASD